MMFQTQAQCLLENIHAFCQIIKRVHRKNILYRIYYHSNRIVIQKYPVNCNQQQILHVKGCLLLLSPCSTILLKPTIIIVDVTESYTFVVGAELNQKPAMVAVRVHQSTPVNVPFETSSKLNILKFISHNALHPDTLDFFFANIPNHFRTTFINFSGQTSGNISVCL